MASTFGSSRDSNEQRLFRFVCVPVLLLCALTLVFPVACFVGRAFGSGLHFLDNVAGACSFALFCELWVRF